MGNSGKGSTGYMIPAIAKPLLDLKVKVIGGYEGSRDTILAMEKGEIDGTVQAWQAWLQARPAWFTGADSYGVALLQVGVTPDPDAPKVPLLSDLVGKEDRPIVALFDGRWPLPTRVCRSARNAAGIRRGAAARLRQHDGGRRLPRRGAEVAIARAAQVRRRTAEGDRRRHRQRRCRHRRTRSSGFQSELRRVFNPPRSMPVGVLPQPQPALLLCPAITLHMAVDDARIGPCCCQLFTPTDSVANTSSAGRRNAPR